MIDEEKIVKQVATAMVEASYQDQSVTRAAIAAYKAALAEAGYVIVPREPTEAMAYSGSEVRGYIRGEESVGEEIGHHPAVRCWAAMIEAAPK